jgi:hypothetical protein
MLRDAAANVMACHHHRTRVAECREEAQQPR